MPSEALRRFESSMAVGYEQWHDGIGYDLDALDRLSEAEKRHAERLLVPRAHKDWRDLEALDRLGTPNAIAAILQARKTADPEMRLRAHRYGPQPTAAEWESAILGSLENAVIYASLTQALDCAIEHPSARVVLMLWEKVRSASDGVPYHCAAALCCIGGVLDSQHDDRFRDLFLRLAGPSGATRKDAVRELEALLSSDRARGA